jgi:4'-phosphopantetheinyl transferase
MSLPFDSFDFVLSAERGVLEFRPPDGDTSANWWFVELEPAPQSLVALAIEVNAAPVRRVVLRHGFPWRRSDPLVITLPQSQVAGEEHY